MGLLSNRVAKGSLKPGDHIYSWRTAYIYAHHGIYIGDDKVIHFTRRGQEVGTGTVLDILLVSSGPARPQRPCEVCTPREESSGVLCSCLNCFLAGGVLYRFEYAVNPALFLAKARGGTCTLAVSDPDDVVVHRAKYLLENGFGCYCIFKNNCEDFAIYCKTGLLVMDQRTLGQSGQAASIIGGPLAAVLATPMRLVTTNLYGMVAVGIGVYCASRYSADIGKRIDVVKVSVEDMTRRLAAGLLQVSEAQISAPLLQAPESQISAPLLQAPSAPLLQAPTTPLLQASESQISTPLLQAPSAPLLQASESQITAAPASGSSNLFFWSRSSSNLVTR